MRRSIFALLLAAVLSVSSTALAQPLTTAFTYQGELSNAGAPVTGNYDLRFRLFDAAAAGTQLGPTLCADNTQVTNGRFTVSLDFGSQFAGQQRFLQIEAVADAGQNCAAAVGFITLAPRQPLTSAPNASFSLTSANAVQLNGQSPAFYQSAANLTSGTLPSARLSGGYTSQLTLSNTLNQFTGTFTGNGAAITNLSAASLSGSLSDALLSTNIARRNTTNTFTSANTFNTNAYFLNRIGVGTSSPTRPLHVFDGSAGAVTPSANALAVIERDQNAYLNFLTPASSLSGVLFGSPNNEADGGIIYDHSFRSLQLRTGGNITRMHINPFGSVGIGTTTPETLLHLQSSADVSTSGSGVLTMGNYPNGTFMNADSNEIQVFNADTPADLYLNAIGGRVRVGSGAAPTADLDVTGSIHAFSISTDQNAAIAGSIAIGDGGLEPRFAAGAGSFGDTLMTLNSSGDRYCRFDMTEDNATNYGAWFEYNGIQNWFSIGTMDGSYGEAIRINRGSNNVQFFGNISKGGGSFKIDHPLDPANKFLYHSFVESPDMMNIYNGNAVTNPDGFAIVTMPDWFNALNSDFRYQLTITDENAPDVCFARVSRKLGSDAPNEFTIKTTPGNLEVSWQVTGVRKDAYAQANRIPVEVNKAPDEKGRYLHPAAFGLPADRGLSGRHLENTQPAKTTASKP